jgi:hypothetical protein
MNIIRMLCGGVRMLKELYHQRRVGGMGLFPYFSGHILSG